MYIPKNDQNIKEEIKKENQEQEALEAPRDMLIEEQSEDVLASWQAPEFEIMERDRKWYLYITLVLIAIIAYAVITNSPIMAITFILIGVVGYIYINKEPRQLTFLISEDGIMAGNEMYDFKNIRSFWIFYEPHDIKIISLKTGSYLVPYVHIPIEDEDPVKIREILLKYIPEEKQEHGIQEILGRLLKF